MIPLYNTPSSQIARAGWAEAAHECKTGTASSDSANPGAALTEQEVSRACEFDMSGAIVTFVVGLLLFMLLGVTILTGAERIAKSLVRIGKRHAASRKNAKRGQKQ